MAPTEVWEKYDLTDEDLNEILTIFGRMRTKYGEHYRDMLEVLYQLTEPDK